MRDDTGLPAAAREFQPPAPQALTIEGPAGAIEARLEDPSSAGTKPTVVGIVCHPHPLYGGTMQNKVVHTTARAMQQAGAATVRFNFRGVGASSGVHDAGVGEIEDALVVVEWVRSHFDCERVWLGGFSFGAAVALQAAADDRARVERLVTVAPPVGRFLRESIPRPACPWLVVQGDKDDLVDVARVREWIAGYQPPVELVVVAGAEHFFHGKLVELREAVLQFLRK